MKKLIKKIRHNIKLHRAYQDNLTSTADIHYLIPFNNWSNYHDGECLMGALPEKQGRLAFSSRGLKQGLCHFGGITAAISGRHIRWPNPSIPCGLTWFHAKENDKRLSLVPTLDKTLAFWHSSCETMTDLLIKHGASPEKVHLIPLGVDNHVFAPSSAEAKQAFRRKLNIDDDHIVIGSFQKDGFGWKDGHKPKLIKGPDILCSTLEALAKRHKVFVLLSGPARGYVKQRLDEANIPYHHTGYLSHANDVAHYFKLLDIYVVSSRIEGGPKAVLEAPASGIPLVTSATGMVPDIITHGETGMIANCEDVTDFVKQCERVIEDKALADKLKKKGREMAEEYSWHNISNRYYKELYEPLLDD